jgi:peptide/nickel transport system permease protein
MAKFLLRRLINSLILVAIATSVAYILAGVTLKPRSHFESRNPRPPERVVNQVLDERNINDRTPILERYGTWVSGLSHFDFGQTWDGDSVNDEMGRRILVSLRLLIIGTVLGSLLGVLLGAWGAVRQYKLSDHIGTLFAFVLLSTPTFVLAVILETVAIGINNAVGSQIFLYTGEFTPGLDGFWTQAQDRIQHLVLPTLTLILIEAALFSRYQRNAMLDVLGSDYVRTAQAKGLSRRRALLKHALRTALIPSATLFAYSFGTVLVGAVFVESIFGWHGMGEWLVQSIQTNDINATAAIACFTAVLILIAGLMSDIFYAILDPRIRVS